MTPSYSTNVLVIKAQESCKLDTKGADVILLSPSIGTSERPALYKTAQAPGPGQYNIRGKLSTAGIGY